VYIIAICIVYIPTRRFDMRTSIVHNKISCVKCGETIESNNVHDFNRCSCGAVAVDGGKEYLKRIGMREHWIEQSEFIEVPSTYGELRDQLNKLTEEQLACDIVIWDAGAEVMHYDGVLKVYVKKDDSNISDDLLDDGCPYIEINS